MRGLGSGSGIGRLATVLFAATVVSAATGCSDRAGGAGSDAGIDVPREASDGPGPDLTSHAPVDAHGYDDAGRPGTLGDPLTAPNDQQWTWVPFSDAHCRDGTPTGIGFNPSRASKNLVLFLDQGGACFEPFTCGGNASHYDIVNFADNLHSRTFDSGIFNRADPDNPVRDWSFVVVPYCTGDVHAGTATAGAVSGLGPQQFVGYRNLDVFLARIVPSFIDAQQVLFAGSSAGGFGVLLNADHVARWFAPVPITVLSDSGPPMPNAVVPPCLEQQWLDTWGYAAGPMLDCGIDCPSTSDYMVDHVLHFGWRYPSYRGGLISATEDATIRTFFSFGVDDCHPTSNTVGPNAVPADLYQAGLGYFRDTMTAQHAPFSTFFLGGESRHIWLMDDARFATTVGGVSVKQWVGQLLDGDPGNVGP